MTFSIFGKAFGHRHTSTIRSVSDVLG